MSGAVSGGAALSAAALYDRIRGCTLCPLSRTRTLAVPGEGPLDADVMFIGEAPGANEDKQGRPFVGAARQFLTELLAAADLKRDDVYICNVLKCRPPGNRDPLPGEIDACRDYLDEQIDLVDPLVIVTLGRFSMARYFPNQAISRIHGRPRETAGVYYVPMYHPAAALHQQSLKAVMIEDFQKLGALLERARSHRAASAAPTQVVQLMLVPGSSPDEIPPVETSIPSPQNDAAPAHQQIRLFD